MRSNHNSAFDRHPAWIRLMLEQPLLIGLGQHSFLTALLKQEPRNRNLHQSVLVPLGVATDESAHGLLQILRQLVFHIHVRWHGIECGQQVCPLTFSAPSPHFPCSFVKARQVAGNGWSRRRQALLLQWFW